MEVASQLGHTVASIDIGSQSEFEEPWRRRAAALRTEIVEKASTNTYLFDPGKDADRFAEIVSQLEPTVILNCGGNSLASEFSNSQSILEETMTRLNQVLLERCFASHVRYVYVSSSMVYGNFAEIPIQESSPKDPIDPYGALKFGCELLIRAFAHQNESLDYAILRPSAVYGALDSNRRVLVKMLHSIDEGEALFVRDEEERLDFTPVYSVAKMIVKVLEHPGVIRETYNVSNGQAASMAEVVEALRQIFADVVISLASGAKAEEDIRRPRRGTLSMAPFERDFGPTKRVEILDGLRRLVDDSRKHHLLSGRLRSTGE